MMKDYASIMRGQALCALAMLACCDSILHGQEHQGEKGKTQVTIRLVSDDPARALPKTIAEENLARILGIDVSLTFYESKGPIGGTGITLSNIEYTNGVVKAKMDSPRNMFEPVGAYAKIEGFDECLMRFSLDPHLIFPWAGRSETLTVIDPDIREMEVIIPVRYYRSTAEGYPSQRMRFRLLSGATSEPLPSFQLTLRSPQWSRHFSQKVKTDEHGYFEALVYGDEEIVVEQYPPGKFHPDQVRPTTVTKDLVAKHLKDGKPLVVKGAVPLLTGTLSTGDPEQDAIIAKSKGRASVRCYYGKNNVYLQQVSIEHGRFSIFEDNSPMIKPGMKTRLSELGGDFEHYVLTSDATFPFPKAGEHRRIVFSVAAPKAVEIRADVRAKTGNASVSGARIALVRHGVKPVRLTTDANGRAVASVPAGEYRVAVAAPGYVESLRNVTIVKPKTLKFDLLKTVSFEIIAEGEGMDGLEAAMLASTETETLYLADFVAGQTRAMVKDVPEGRAVAMIGNRQGDIVGVEGVNVVEQGRARMVLGKPITLKANFKAEKQTRARVSILLVDKETRVPMHPLHPAGDPLELRVPRRAYHAYAVVPRELLARNEAVEAEEDLAQAPEVWVHVGDLDLRNANVDKPKEVSWELMKLYKPLRKPDVLHPAFH